MVFIRVFLSPAKLYFLSSATIYPSLRFFSLTLPVATAVLIIAFINFVPCTTVNTSETLISSKAFILPSAPIISDFFTKGSKSNLALSILLNNEFSSSFILLTITVW